MLLEKGALVDEPNGAGITPLALAVNFWSPTMSDNQKEVAYQLLQYGAAVNQNTGSSEITGLQAAIIQLIRRRRASYCSLPPQTRS